MLHLIQFCLDLAGRWPTSCSGLSVLCASHASCCGSVPVMVKILCAPPVPGCYSTHAAHNVHGTIQQVWLIWQSVCHLRLAGWDGMGCSSFFKKVCFCAQPRWVVHRALLWISIGCGHWWCFHGCCQASWGDDCRAVRCCVRCQDFNNSSAVCSLVRPELRTQLSEFQLSELVQGYSWNSTQMRKVETYQIQDLMQQDRAHNT
jgi:hypothetical protein